MENLIQSSCYGLDENNLDYEYSFSFSCHPNMSEDQRKIILNRVLAEVVLNSKDILDGVAPFHLDPRNMHYNAFGVRKHQENSTEVLQEK